MKLGRDANLPVESNDPDRNSFVKFLFIAVFCAVSAMTLAIIIEPAKELASWIQPASPTQKTEANARSSDISDGQDDRPREQSSTPEWAKYWHVEALGEERKLSQPVLISRREAEIRKAFELDEAASRQHLANALDKSLSEINSKIAKEKLLVASKSATDNSTARLNVYRQKAEEVLKKYEESLAELRTTMADKKARRLRILHDSQ